MEGRNDKMDDVIALLKILVSDQRTFFNQIEIP